MSHSGGHFSPDKINKSLAKLAHPHTAPANARAEGGIRQFAGEDCSWKLGICQLVHRGCHLLPCCCWPDSLSFPQFHIRHHTPKLRPEAARPHKTCEHLLQQTKPPLLLLHSPQVGVQPAGRLLIGSDPPVRTPTPPVGDAGELVRNHRGASSASHLLLPPV